MGGSGYDPQLLVSRFGFEKRVDHPCGHEIVGIAVDEHHGQLASLNLPKSRGFPKVPSVFQRAQPTRHVEQRKGRQPELFLELFGKLVADVKSAGYFSSVVTLW